MCEFEPDYRRVTQPPQLDATLAGIQDAALDSSCNANEFESRSTELRAQLGADLALAARRRNAALSLQSRIPPELWCLVWQDLPLEDRLSITRVCHAWRAIAYAAPHVWTLLDVVVDVHNPNCDCDRCLEDADLYRKRSFAPQAAPITETNLHLVERALQLGKQSPIVLQLTDESRFSDEEAYRHLGEMLSSHAHRICAIYLLVTDNEVLILLFDHLALFPALRVLHLLCDTAESSLQEFAAAPLKAPLLEKLVMTNTISWLCGIPEHATFAKLHILRCPVWSAQDTLRLLNACPGLLRVRFDVTWAEAEDHGLGPVDLDRARRLARRIPDITVYGLRASTEARFLDLFAMAEVECLTLSYLTNESPSLRGIRDVASHCNGDSVTCACYAYSAGDFGTFKIDTGPSKHRIIIQSTDGDALQRTWQGLVVEVATNLIIDFALLPLLLESDNAKPMAKVTTLSVLLRSDEDVARFITSRSLRLDLFPSLLEIRYDDQTASLVARAKDLIFRDNTLKMRRDRRPHLGFPMVVDADGEGDQLTASTDTKRVTLVVCPLA